jgi:hypothetical protein
MSCDAPTKRGEHAVVDGFLVPIVTNAMRARASERQRDARIQAIQAATKIEPGVICIERRLFALEGNSQVHMLQVRKVVVDAERNNEERAVVYSAKHPSTTSVRSIRCDDLVFCFKDLAAMSE